MGKVIRLAAERARLRLLEEGLGGVEDALVTLQRSERAFRRLGMSKDAEIVAGVRERVRTARRQLPERVTRLALPKIDLSELPPAA